MSVEVKGGDVFLKKFSKFAASILSPKIPFLIASDLRNLIVKRNKQGTGLKGRFKKYSTHPYYRLKTQRPVARGGMPSKTGNTVFYEGGYDQFAKETKGTTTPNLFASGDMVRQMQAKPVDEKTAQIIFLTERSAMKAIANNESREFFGATLPERNLLSGNFNKIVRRAIKEAKLS